MKLQLLQELNNSGTPLPISSKPNPTIDKKPDNKKYLLKVKINTQLGGINIKMVSDK